MPEATMDEHDRPISRKHNVWCARQSPNMQTKAVAEVVQKAAHQSFRPGVPAPDVRHDGGAFGRLEDIGHLIPAE